MHIGFWATAGAGAAGGGAAMELISSTILSSASASVSFSSIPATYKHLQIRMTARTSDSVNFGIEGLRVQFNSDTNANYSAHDIMGNGSSVGSNGYTNLSAMNPGVNPTSMQASGVFGARIIDLLDYASTAKYKTLRSFSGHSASESRVYLSSGSWRSTSAVSSIQLFNGNSYNFTAGSRFSLYGISG